VVNRDASSLMKAVASVVREYVDVRLFKALQPFADIQFRLKALEDRPLLARDGMQGQPGRDGRDADPSHIAELKAEIAGLKSTLSALSELPGNASLLARVAVLEAREPIPGPPGLPGPQGLPGGNGTVDLIDVESMVETRVQKALAALPPLPSAYEQFHGARELIAMLVKDVVGDAVGRLPTSPPIDVEPIVLASVEKAVAALPKPRDGQDGASVDADAVVSTVMALLDARVEKALASLPAPQDGHSVTVEDVTPLIESAVQKAVEALPVAKDGVGWSGAVVGRDGHLVATLTDGTVKDVGSVVGRDVDMVEVRRVILEEVAKIPPPKDGAPGPPGRDGTLENLKVAFDGERVVSFVHKDGTPLEGGIIRFPNVLDRGVYKAGTSYQQGDSVTFGGSVFIAQRDTLGSEKPEDASGAFRLSIKRGQNGSTGPVGKAGDRGPQGPAGTPGRDGSRH